MFCHGPRRLGRCAVGGKFEGNRVLEQVGSRGGQEEVLEFSKRTAAQVKDILAQGQVFLRTITWRCVHDERSVFEDTELRPWYERKLKVAVTLGGDHSIGLGTLAGSLQHNPDTVVLWVVVIVVINMDSDC